MIQKRQLYGYPKYSAPTKVIGVLAGLWLVVSLPLMADSLPPELDEETAPFRIDDGGVPVTEEIYSKSYMREFINAFCLGDLKKKSTDKLSKACNKKLLNTYLSRLIDRYKLANPQDVERSCNSYPLKCQDSKNIERWFAESHNQRLTTYIQARLRQISLSRLQQLQNFQRFEFDSSMQMMNLWNRAGNQIGCALTPLRKDCMNSVGYPE